MININTPQFHEYLKSICKSYTKLFKHLSEFSKYSDSIYCEVTDYLNSTYYIRLIQNSPGYNQNVFLINFKYGEEFQKRNKSGDGNLVLSDLVPNYGCAIELLKNDIIELKNQCQNDDFKIPTLIHIDYAYNRYYGIT